MERDCESELSKLNIEQNACIYHFGASVIHGQRSNILRLPSSGGNRLPVIQRILLSYTPLKVSAQDTTDIDFIKGQLRLNHSEILISNDSLTELKTTYEGNAEIVDFFKNFENLARKQEYLILDESSMREIPVASDIKTEGLGILRNASYAARYNKVSTKTDESIFDYICKKYKT